MMRATPVAVIAVVALLVLLAPVAAAGQDRRGLVWDDRPKIVFGEDLTVELKGRIQLDWRWFDPDLGEELFDFRTLRLGLKGDLTRHFEWEIERAAEEIEERWQPGDWKDVYINWRTFHAVRVKAGRFKMPFGLEQNTSVSDLDFAFRSLGSAIITPARDTGAMVYGELLDGSLVYEGGVFEHDGDNGALDEPQFVEDGQEAEDVGPSVAVRVTGEIFRRLPMPDRLKGAEVAVAYTTAQVPEGLNSLKGEGVWGDDFFEPVYVNGRRQRLGFQFDWSPGPTGFKAEWMQSREERQGQGNRNEDLSDFIGEAWYASATWLVTGEDKDSDVQARRPVFQGGFGAVEIGIRYDSLTFRSASTDGPAYTNPRADHLVPNSSSNVTFGGNWLLNRWVKVIANGIHTTIDDETRTPVSGVTSYWSGLVRLQVAF
jgi:phosphate-selective porin OprO/OprP